MLKLRDNQAFTYKANSKDGAVNGEIVAKDISLAKTLLRKQGVEVVSIKPKRSKSNFSGGKVNAADIAMFSRQMATMLSSGISLTQALDIVIDGAEKTSYRKMIKGLKEEVENGNSFAVALKRFPFIFDELFYNLVAAGEQSGSLEKMLNRIALYKEKTETIKRKIKKAMYYPIAILTVSFIVSGVLLIKVVPSFKKMFDGFGSKLPKFTLMVLALSDFCKSNWYIIFGGILGSVWSFGYCYKRSTMFKQFIQRLILKLPIMGSIMHDAAIARFARTLSTTFAAGVPLTEALVTVAKASGNIVYEQAITKIKEAVSTGQNLQISMQRSGIFPIMVVQMISIGEEAGSLEQMLERVANIFEEEVNSKVDGLTSLLEPLIMVILGVLVGSLVIAMFLPIFNMGSAM